jgi:hypothetical protein
MHRAVGGGGVICLSVSDVPTMLTLYVYVMLCSDSDSACFNLVPAEITMKIVKKIKVSMQRWLL